ncbi:MAG: hypothetical protein M1818_007574 [Claussenomyces sp. TS43310]|nr:MAG: hypothetical protein M1818_007574 [Claussenomyces sp. TS43310]
MPSPPVQDSNPPNDNGSHNKKQAPKPSTSGAHILTKKERKNGAAKESGTSSGAMKPNAKTTDSTKPSPPLTAAPECKPAETRQIPTMANGSTITSPLLDALSSNAFTATTAQSTNEWARNVPAFSTSPGNLISLSDSPPTQPPSSQEDRNTLAGWNNRERGIPNGQISSASSPPARTRPLSVQMDGHHLFDDQTSQRAAFTYRRSSWYSQQPHRFTPNPPLPHHSQAHFYGAPDPSFGLPSRVAGLKPGSRGYYCGFDKLSASVDGTLKQVDNAVISGYEGGFDVYGVSNSALDKIISINGLRGGVFNAKILPWMVDDKHNAEDPLIAVVVHGPVLHSKDISDVQSFAQAESEVNPTPLRGCSTSERFSPSPEDHSESLITHYQTTVEIYSLRSKRHVTTVLSTPKVPLIAPITSSIFSPPPPTGSLNILADAGHLAVASGTTGEVWIFEQLLLEGDTKFRCIGKTWTVVQRTILRDPASPSEYEDGDGPFGESKTSLQQSKSPLVSLKGRWLAYCPSAATSQTPLRATVPHLEAASRVPGLNSFAPPPLPQVTCVVDMPNKDRLYNDIVRMGTQGVIKGAGWIGDHGKQAWNSYWNKSPNPHTAFSTTSGWHGSSPPSGYHNQFPPTHGETLPQKSSGGDSRLISLLDLGKLSAVRNPPSTVSPHPFVTFESPLGCSFISFAPSGLSLFSASSNGDVQFIWDLMRIQFTKSSLLQIRPTSSTQGYHVRQVARFTRMTVARIVDVVWASPRGERLAVITERNTVHFLDLPASAFDWPPPRRRIEAEQKTSTAAREVTDVPKAAATMATNAVSAAWNFAQPLISRPRGMSGPGRSGISAASVTAQAGYGTKALAAGISKSFGAASGTIEQFRKSGENILRLPQVTAPLTAACIQWMGGQSKGSLCAVVDGVVKIYKLKQKRSKGHSDRRRASVSGRANDIALPLISDRKIAPSITSTLGLDDELELSDKEPEGPQWKLSRPTAVKAGGPSGTDSSIPQAEIESNAPYQPFHTDRRVGLYVYHTQISQPSPQPSWPSVSVLLHAQSTIKEENPDSLSAPPPAEVENSLWVFGRPILAVKLDVGSNEGAENGDQDLELRSDHLALPPSAMERITTKLPDADEDLEQIVLTTRRRKGGQHGNMPAGDQEGFFEDDCEVLDFASQRV